MIRVTVKGPNGRAIYVNGEYGESVGTIEKSLALSPGSHKFETVRRKLKSEGGDEVDFRGRVSKVPNNSKVEVVLKPVVPPEPIGP